MRFLRWAADMAWQALATRLNKDALREREKKGREMH